MKRIYLVVAMLIIFSVIAADYVYHRQLANAQDAGTTTTPPQAANMAASSQNNPGSDYDNTTMREPLATKDVTVIKTHGNKHKRQSSKSFKPNAYQPNNGFYYADQEVPASESAKTYFAYSAPPKKPEYRTVVTYDVAKEDNSPCTSRLRFGPEFGLNQNSLIDNGTSNIATLGFHVGIAMDLALNDNISFQPVLRYIKKGNQLQDQMNIDTREKLSMNYIELPANIVFKLGNVNNTRFLVGMGPYASYLVSAHDEFQTDATEDVLGDVPATASYSASKIQRFDWGVDGFIGCETPEGIYAKAGAEVGLKDIQQNMDGSWSNRNFSILLSLGYLFSK